MRDIVQHISAMADAPQPAQRLSVECSVNDRRWLNRGKNQKRGQEIDKTQAPGELPGGIGWFPVEDVLIQGSGNQINHCGQNHRRQKPSGPELGSRARTAQDQGKQAA